MILRAIEERYLTSTALGEPIVAFNFDQLQEDACEQRIVAAKA